MMDDEPFCTAGDDGLCRIHPTCAMVQGMLASLEERAETLNEAICFALEHIDYLRRVWGDEGITRTVVDKLRKAVNR